MEAYFNGQDDPMRQIRDDFFIFFNAMLKEIERHIPEKGLDYRKKTITVMRSIFGETDGAITTEAEVIEITAIEAFNRQLEEAFENWQKNRTSTNLVDLANLCGMLWLHEKGVFNENKKDEGKIHKP